MINFYNDAKKFSNESIINFIEEHDLNISKLSDYLIKTQKDKVYMLFKNNTFYMEKINIDNYQLKTFVKESNKSSYIATTTNGNRIKILLRWKNGNGIAFPAFQIS